MQLPLRRLTASQKIKRISASSAERINNKNWELPVARYRQVEKLKKKRRRRKKKKKGGGGGEGDLKDMTGSFLMSWVTAGQT